MMNTVAGKLILVTGAAQGLGAAICRKLAKEGAAVIATDLNKEKLNGVVESIRNDEGIIEGYEMDVSDPASVSETVDRVINTHGSIYGVVNNAGIDYTKPIEELEFNEWNKVIAVNLTGPFNVSKIVYSHLKENGRGHIINIASTASKRAWPNASAYHASKWGLLGFSHALHAEARQDNIKVTAVLAGGMQTPFILERFPDVDPALLQDPGNVAETVVYVLCQPGETVIPEVLVIPMKETSWP
jgi:NAD(P)-dependent dehydrogenase (short-subunit alcohol dehydrogenase family)